MVPSLKGHRGGVSPDWGDPKPEVPQTGRAQTRGVFPRQGGPQTGGPRTGGYPNINSVISILGFKTILSFYIINLKVMILNHVKTSYSKHRKLALID